jgi:Domain of unknown function (DUF4345)
MKPVAIPTAVGLLTLALGCVGLFDPLMVMGFVGLDTASASYGAAVLSEVRAVYGGLFAVIGIYTLLAALSPGNHRPMLLFISFMWLGLCGGRLFGIWIEGYPGVKGLVSAGFEFAMGVGLLISSRAEPLSGSATQTQKAA